MIYFDKIKDYAPFGKKDNLILFGFVTENKLFGQTIGVIKLAYVCGVLCIKPENVSYRRSFMRLAPVKFIPHLEQSGYSKTSYVFIVEKIQSLPENLDIINQDLYNKIISAKIELPPTSKKQ